MNAKLKEKLIVALWQLFWCTARALMILVSVVSTSLWLWNMSYSIRGYNTIGGEFVIVVLMAICAYYIGRVLHESHVEMRKELKKDEYLQFAAATSGTEERENTISDMR